MTDLGPGPGPDPWHQGDPLSDPDWGGYGTPPRGRDGRAAQAAQVPQWGGQTDPLGQYDPLGDPYGQPASYGHQQPYGQGEPPGPGQYGLDDPYTQTGHYQYGHDPYANPYPNDPYGQPDPYGHGGQPGPGDPYGRPDPYGQSYPQDPYAGQHPYPDQQAPPGNGPPQYGRQQRRPQYDGYPDQGGYPDPGAYQDPAGYQAQGQHHQGQHHQGQHQGQQPQGTDPHDPYGGQQPAPGPGGDDPGQPPRRRRGPIDDHPFFADAPDQPDADEDDEDPDGDPAPRGDRRRGQQKRKPRRSGVACLFVVVVLGGGVYAAGHYGYAFYQAHFGPAPDYQGSGEGEVQVEIPDGATSSAIGQLLHDKGVVKSGAAFIDAANGDAEKARAIQPGVYTLKRHMSAASAFDALTDTANLNVLTIPEGYRATQVYAAVDKRLHLKSGTTAKAAKGADLGLPSYAKGNPEGFLFPTRYSVAKDTKPVDLLRQMVKQAESEYQDDGLADAAKSVHKTPYQVLTLASIVQAEAKDAPDFPKVARVLYNRMDSSATNGLLQMDSTVNYALGRSTLDVTHKDTGIDSPYNTYRHKGLPPGPIGNPGNDAINAALHPAKGDWLYFVTVKPGDTRFTASKAQHDKNVQDFNEYQKEHGGG